MAADRSLAPGGRLRRAWRATSPRSSAAAPTCSTWTSWTATSCPTCRWGRRSSRRSGASRRVPLDVHLMIDDPDRYHPRRSSTPARRGSRSTSRCCPTCTGPCSSSQRCGVKAGVAINPSTPVGALEEIAGDVDQVLVMSVNPGFGGQTFIPRSESKIRAVRALLDGAGNRGAGHGRRRRRSRRTPGALVAAGAGILVAGQRHFRGRRPPSAPPASSASSRTGSARERPRRPH